MVQVIVVWVMRYGVWRWSLKPYVVFGPYCLCPNEGYLLLIRLWVKDEWDYRLLKMWSGSSEELWIGGLICIKSQPLRSLTKRPSTYSVPLSFRSKVIYSIACSLRAGSIKVTELRGLPTSSNNHGMAFAHVSFMDKHVKSSQGCWTLCYKHSNLGTGATSDELPSFR